MSLGKKVEDSLSTQLVRRAKYIQEGWKVAPVDEFAMKDCKFQQDCRQCSVSGQCPIDK